MTAKNSMSSVKRGMRMAIRMSGRAARVPVKTNGWRFISSSSSSEDARETGAQGQDRSSQASSNVKDHGSSETMTAGLAGSAKLFTDTFVEESHAQSSSGSTSSNRNGAFSSDASPDTSDTDTTGLTGSTKLFADALVEESHSSSAPSSSSPGRIAQFIQEHTNKHENWTGDERIQDSVLRMLVDKYKPLRGPVIRSAEEKLKDRPPAIRSSSTSTVDSRVDFDLDYRTDWVGRASEPLLPSVEGHRPWHTTFTPPSALTPRVKLGSFSSSSSSRKVVGDGVGVGPKQDIAAARRNATAQRLGRARESMIDYKLGVSQSRSSSSAEPRRPPPLGLKAWSNLIEERIERARREGQFKTLKGRGKPIVRESEETNPFIAREEFLINRIVQRNQAAPAWVELQNEVENAIQTFRAILHQTWTRRAILILTSRHPPPTLSALTLSDTRALRDPSWVTRESSYHTSALEEVNEVVRRYNGVAPYAVRKAYFVREKELERVYYESGEDILEGVKERFRKGGTTRKRNGAELGEEVGGGDGVEGENGRSEKGMSLWEVVRTWIASLRAG